MKALMEKAETQGTGAYLDDDCNVVITGWLLSYGPKGSDRWWNRFLKKGFYHSAILTYDGFEYIFHNHGMTHTHATVLPILGCTDVDEVIEALCKSWGVDEMTSVPFCCTINHEIRSALPISMDTCVESCKRQMGITKRSVLTPYQLHNFTSEHHKMSTPKAPKVDPAVKELQDQQLASEEARLEDEKKMMSKRKDALKSKSVGKRSLIYTSEGGVK